MLAFVPIIRTIPMTITRTTANMIAYSATSWPSVSRQHLYRNERMSYLLDPDLQTMSKLARHRHGYKVGKVISGGALRERALASVQW